MKKIILCVLLYITTTLFISCSSEKKLSLSPTSPVPFPSDLNSRLYVSSSSGINPNNLADLPGRLIVFFKGDSGQISYMVSPTKFLTSSAKVTTLNKPIIRYSSIIDQSAGASVSAVIGNLDFTNSKSYEFLVTDANSVGFGTSLNDAPIDSIINANNCPTSAVKVFYITGATLVTIATKTFTSFNTKDAVSGYVVNVNGNYSSSNTDFALDYKVGIDFSDVSWSAFKNIKVEGADIVQNDVLFKRFPNSMNGQGGNLAQSFTPSSGLQNNQNSNNIQALVEDTAINNIKNKYKKSELQNVINSHPEDINKIIVK